MSEEIILSIQTELRSLGILQHMLTCLGIEVEIENIERKYQTIYAAKGKDFTLIARDTMLEKMSRPHRMEVAVGIRPQVEVTMVLNKEKELDTIFASVAKVTLEILAKIDGDAVLHMGDHVLLLRKAQRLIISNSLGFWSDECLALIKSEYETQEITLS